MSQITTRAKGSIYENIALNHLEKAGLRLIGRNFNCKLGEIDIICKDKQTIVFVEVRFRRSITFGSALESVTPAKCLKLRKTALVYQKQYGLINTPSRFDVIGITLKNNQTHIEWVQNAL